MTAFASPRQEQWFRRETARSQAPGIAYMSFQCPACHQYRQVAGRRKIAGQWRCRECVK